MESMSRTPSAPDGNLRFTSMMVQGIDLEETVPALAEGLHHGLEGKPADLVLLFLSGHHAAAAADIAGALQEALQPTTLLGCTAEGVIGNLHEVERRPAMSAMAAHLPAVETRAFSLREEDWTAVLWAGGELQARLGPPEGSRVILLLADPFSTPTAELLDALNHSYPGVPVVGGIASGSMHPGENVLIHNGTPQNEGVVGVGLRGDISVDVIVSQGCRPVGRPYVVTAANGNVIYGLEGRSPLEVIEEVIAGLSETDQDLLQRNGLFVGRAIDPDREDLGRGDFLIRAVVGVDQRSGAIAIGDYIHNGEVVQFHLRDAATAEEDLDLMLSLQSLYEPPSGALLFSCNGRGQRLYGRPDGDVSVLRQALGEVQVAGFFCAGEFGPVGGRNFLHGHTASLVLFRPAGRARQLRSSEPPAEGNG